MKKLNKIYFVIFILLLTGCGTIPLVTENFIKSSTSFDESEIMIDESKNCDYESIIRENFPKYRLHRHSENEIWFYDFKKIINSTGAGNFYLMEVFSINNSNPTKTTCSVKYFSSLEKRLNRIKKTYETGDGINKLIETVKKCDNGR